MQHNARKEHEMSDMEKIANDDATDFEAQRTADSKVEPKVEPDFEGHRIAKVEPKVEPDFEGHRMELKVEPKVESRVSD